MPPRFDSDSNESLELATWQRPHGATRILTNADAVYPIQPSERYVACKRLDGGLAGQYLSNLD